MAYTAFFMVLFLRRQFELVKTLLGFQLRVCSWYAMVQHLLDCVIMELKVFVGFWFLHCSSCKDDPFCIFSLFYSPPLFVFWQTSLFICTGTYTL